MLRKNKINKDIYQLLVKGDVLDGKRSLKYERELVKVYKTSLGNIRRMISEIYRKYGDNVTYAEMMKYNRLASLQNAIAGEMKRLGVKANRKVTSGIKESYQESFLYTGFAIEVATQVKLGFSPLGTDAVEASVVNPLANVKWPDSMKISIETATRRINQEIAAGLIEGKGYSKTAKEVSSRIDRSFNDSKRIVWTETHRVQAAGRLKGYQRSLRALDDAGIKQQKVWLATLDGITRTNHGAMDGVAASKNDDKFLFTTMSGSTIRVEAPGLTNTTDDINCRCTTVLQFPDIPETVRRDNVTKEVIPWTTYDDWVKNRLSQAA